ncbi:MAG: GNAT family protein [Pseudomonadota bacterium]
MEPQNLPAFSVASLDLQDVGLVYQLHKAAVAAVQNPDAVRPDTPPFFEGVFQDGGEIWGLFDGEGLAAYGVLRPELAREHDRQGLQRDVGADEPMRVLDGSATRPSLWGKGLQRHVVDMRVKRAGDLGADHVIAKAAPRNVPSMRNLLRCGFAIVGLVRKPYGWRYVHHRPVRAAVAFEGAGEWQPATSIKAAEERFLLGEGAVACDAPQQGEAQLKFAPLVRPSHA